MAVQMCFERYQYGQISVSRKFQITEDCAVSTNNIVQNSTIKKSLIVAADLSNTQYIKQNAVIRNFLITARKEHHDDF